MAVLFIDTNCELWHTKAKELGINNIIKMPYTICDKEYFYDLGESYNPKEFFDLMREGNMPITSCLNAENYKDYFEPYFKQGEDILYLSFSSELSGTFTFLDMAIKELSEKYPKATFTRFDTKGISMGAGLPVYVGARMFNEGKSNIEIVEFLTKFVKKVNTTFSPESLVYLKRGGRLSSAQAIIGSLLQIKPIIKLTDEGKLVNAGKINGRKKALNMLANEAIDNAVELDKYPIVIIEADCKNDADFVVNKIKDALPKAEVWSQSVGPVIGTHCGPATIGVCYIGEQKIK